MVVFVILHYLAEDMTIKCVEHIEKNCDMEKTHIVIVDNASKNDSGFRLAEKYKDIRYCTVILNRENIGFARGNNMGYLYAKQKFDPEFIVVMNNDVLLENKNFYNKIRSIYNETAYHILGPDIVSGRDGKHQNPIRLKPYTHKQVQKIIKERECWLKCYPLHFYGNKLVIALKRIIKRIIRKKDNSMAEINQSAKEKRIENPVLHGACYIFSKDFISNEDDCFNPNTFLYFEEDILNFYARQKGYKMIYDSSISVTHLEDVSTNMEIKNECKKNKTKDAYIIQSAGILLDMMNRREST